MATSELQIVLQRAVKLSPAERVEMIKRLAESLTFNSSAPGQPNHKQLIYAEFRDYPGDFTNEEDFKLAEWHPTNEELEG